MKNHNQEDATQLSYPTNKKQGRLTWPGVVAVKLKGYDNELELKLPNELRGALKGYNYRSESHDDFHIDENDYGYF